MLFGSLGGFYSTLQQVNSPAPPPPFSRNASLLDILTLVHSLLAEE